MTFRGRFVDRAGEERERKEEFWRRHSGIEGAVGGKGRKGKIRKQLSNQTQIQKRRGGGEIGGLASTWVRHHRAEMSLGNAGCGKRTGCVKSWRGGDTASRTCELSV